MSAYGSWALEATEADTPKALVDGELVDDRSLDAIERDEFRHADFVHELAGMVCKTQTPANIALFGAWGSGKSSIANLLEEELPDDQSAVRFIVFDASKYAEAPLRRHFISQVATRLEIDKDKYHRGLYTGEETRDVKFRPGEWAKLAGWFLVSVALTLAVLIAIATLVAAVSAGSFGSNWTHIIRSYLLAALPVAAVIATFVKLAADGFHIKTTQTAPSGDEEFEKLFSDLVAAAKTKRLVVFIDELDRCSPAQVASTLETLKTFLFVKGCVFVVAADQQVLEQALRRKVRQHTPEDAANPYYSAGSSYLDKVFQYQLTLPPLRAPTLSRFALSLVEERPGVWQRIPHLDEVVSVLIPTHVVSPRRVKVLLNRFALAYRLAERRAAEGRLDRDLGARATELAKLICLQAEFPLFAEDLTLDARLPEFVRMVADDEELPPNVRPEVAQRATAYARGQRIVAELLVEDEPEAAAAPAPQQPAAGDDNDRDEASREAPEEAESRATDVARQHAQQLVAYLRKTRHIAGPGPDLVYLESAGAGHGIDAVLAERLQRAALDNDESEVLRLVASAADDGQGRGALLVLADVVRQAQPGVEGRNVVSALLRGIERSGVALDDDADYIADAVAGHLAKAELGADDLIGALELAHSSSRDVGPQLYEAVLTHRSAMSRVEVSVALLDHPPNLRAELTPYLAKATAAALLGAPAAATERLLAMEPDTVQGLLVDARDDLKRKSDAHYAAVKARESDPNADISAVLDPAPHEALSTAYDEVASADEENPGHAVALRTALLRLMLALNQMEYRNAVVHRLSQVAPISDPAFVGEVLRSAHRRAVTDMPPWLTPLDASVIGQDKALQEQVDALAVAVWKAATGDDPPAEGAVEAAAEALERCKENGATEDALRDAITTELSPAFTTDAVVASQARPLDVARQLAEHSLVSRAAVADVELRAVADTLEAPLGGIPSQRRDVPQAVLDRVRAAARHGTAPALERVLNTGSASPWLSELQQAHVQLTVACALRRFDVDTPAPLEAARLRDLVVNYGDDDLVDDTLAQWLDIFAVTPQEVWATVEPLVGAELPRQTSDALSRFSQRLDAAQHFALLEPALERSITAPVHHSFFAAARLSEAPSQRVAQCLVRLFPESEGPSGWEAILAIWQQVSPNAQTSQRLLVDNVYIPLIAEGEAGFDLAIRYFGLVANVKSVRTRVIDAFTAAAQTGDQKKRVDRRLLDAGWKKRSLFGFGPAVEQDDE